jgi:hypothetical protein
MDAETFFNKVENIKMPVRIVILLGTVFLLGALFIWLIYIPKSEEIRQTKSTIASLQQKLDRAKIRSRSLKKFEMAIIMMWRFFSIGSDEWKGSSIF